MASRRVLRSVVSNFLDSYVSRYTNYDGFWLFGFLVKNLAELRFNLLQEPSTAQELPAFAVRRAAEKFQDQLRKSTLDASWVKEAVLEMAKLPEESLCWINNRQVTGSVIRVCLIVEADNGRRFEGERRIVVAPHNKRRERRSSVITL